MANLYSQRTFDNALLLRAAGLLAATATEAIILDIGSGLIDADWVNDVLAIETATGDEKYTIILEGSNVAAMTSGIVELARCDLGNVTAPVTVVSTTGRYMTAFRNEINGTTYRYVRVQSTVAGTIASGINFISWIAKDE